MGKLTFKIKGSLIGQTSLTATALYGSKRVNSKAVPFQFFPPLELEPRNVTLIIGAQFQVQVFGGPGQTDSNLEYSLGHVKIASSDPSGLIIFELYSSFADHSLISGFIQNIAYHRAIFTLFVYVNYYQNNQFY